LGAKQCKKRSEDANAVEQPAHGKIPFVIRDVPLNLPEVTHKSESFGAPIASPNKAIRSLIHAIEALNGIVTTAAFAGAPRSEDGDYLAQSAMDRPKRRKVPLNRQIAPLLSDERRGCGRPVR